MKGFQQGLCPGPSHDGMSIAIEEDLLVGMLLDEPLDLLHDLAEGQFAGPDVDVYVVHH